jgi:undecaprenyl-diphosphatase
VLVGSCAALVVAAATSDIVGNGPVSRAEEDVVWRRTGLVVPWAAVTALGDRPALAAATVVAGLAAVVRHRSPSAALAPVATMVVGSGARWALSRAVRRERPVRARWLVDADGPSFPSRHATAAALGAFALYRTLPGPRILRWPLTAGVVAVGISRVRLGVHWPSDVVAGIALATLTDSVTHLTTNPATSPAGSRRQP